MAPPNQCADVLDAVNDTVLMGVQVTGSAIKDVDTHLKQALQSPQLQNAIKSTLEEIAKKKLGSVPVQFSEEDSKKLIGDLSKKGAEVQPAYGSTRTKWSSTSWAQECWSAAQPRCMWRARAIPSPGH